jgi:hypothetical protein
MLQTVKKLFNWTPSDIVAWERIRKKGLCHFVLWYGLLAFARIMFIVMGAVTFFTWVRAAASLASLLFQLAFVAVVCLLYGTYRDELLTWVAARFRFRIEPVLRPEGQKGFQVLPRR